MILRDAERASERRLILGGAYPHFPLLPIKRDAGENDTGVLVWHFVPLDEEGDGPWTVYLINFWELGERAKAHPEEKPSIAQVLEGVPTATYENLDAFFDAGWRGD